MMALKKNAIKPQIQSLHKNLNKPKVKKRNIKTTLESRLWKRFAKFKCLTSSAAHLCPCGLQGGLGAVLPRGLGRRLSEALGMKPRAWWIPTLVGQVWAAAFIRGWILSGSAGGWCPWRQRRQSGCSPCPWRMWSGSRWPSPCLGSGPDRASG